MTKKTDYESAVLRLEEIVTQLENSELPLEKAIRLFEEGTKLLTSFCYDTLQKAEQKIIAADELKTEADREEEA